MYTQAINAYIHTTSNIHHDQRLNITNVNLWFPVVLCFLKIDLHERFDFFENSNLWDGDCTSGVLCYFLISLTSVNLWGSFLKLNFQNTIISISICEETEHGPYPLLLFSCSNRCYI